MVKDARDRGRSLPRDQAGAGSRHAVRAVGWGLLLTAVLGAALLVDWLPSNRVILDTGDVSSRDILAPRDLTYMSEVRTRQAQDAQAAAVQEIYDLPNPSIARQQEVRALQILEYMGTVRADPYASLVEKAGWIHAIPDLDLPPQVISQILALSPEAWQQVAEESVRVLIQTMQSEIRENQIASVRRNLPTRINIRMTEDQASVIAALAGSLVLPNTFYNAARTEEARLQASEAIQPVMLTVRKGEAIIREGSLVRPVEIETLDAFGLRQQAIHWEAVVGAFLAAALGTALLQLTLFRLRPDLWANRRAVLVSFVLVALFVVLSKVMLPPTDSVLPYLYPLPALAMLLTVLFGPALGIAVGTTVALISAYASGATVEITVYLLAGTLMAALCLGQADRLSAFLRAGAMVALTNSAVILVFGLLAPDQDLLKVTLTALVGVVAGGVAASLALAAFFMLSSFLDVVTPFQLMELSRPTHPLFRQLLLRAPGTYHHTLLVSNMAEEAAERIGADGLLTRVGAYYHDIGKTVRPYFFAENRVAGSNPHDQLDPRTSAQIIVAHVQDGLELAIKHKLPSAIRAFIPEHHGTGLTLAFYRLAIQAAGGNGREVHEDEFRYPGPRPQTKETAITMLADSCEARVRSAEPATTEEVAELIAEAIKARLDDGQLDESSLTLRDLQEVRAAFLSVLQGVFHPRAKYPEPVKVTGPDGKELVR